VLSNFNHCCYYEQPTEKHARAPLSMEWKAAVEQIILALGVASFSLFLLG
jgi:hypothetical protein